MKGMKSRKGRLVMLSVSVMFVFGLLMINPVQAQDGLKFVTLFQGQSASVAFTQDVPFAVKSVFVTSIGNRTMGASFSASSSVAGDGTDASGFWFLTLLGTGGKNPFAAAAGYVPLGSGQNCQVDISSQVSFGLATASVFLWSPGSSGEFGYSIRVGQ